MVTSAQASLADWVAAPVLSATRGNTVYHSITYQRSNPRQKHAAKMAAYTFRRWKIPTVFKVRKLGTRGSVWPMRPGQQQNLPCLWTTQPLFQIYHPGGNFMRQVLKWMCITITITTMIMICFRTPIAVHTLLPMEITGWAPKGREARTMFPRSRREQQAQTKLFPCTTLINQHRWVSAETRSSACFTWNQKPETRSRSRLWNADGRGGPSKRNRQPVYLAEGKGLLSTHSVSGLGGYFMFVLEPSCRGSSGQDSLSISWTPFWFSSHPSSVPFPRLSL